VAQGGAAQADRQLPTGEEIFLDHIGHFVRDREAAAGALARAGFAPAPVSIQTSPAPAGGAPQLTGTGNITAMLTRGYIEVLFKTADTPLGRELDAAVARYSGVHLAALAVADAAAAHRRLAAGGFRMRPLVEMARPVDAGGKRETAAFTIARLEPGEMPEGRIQILTHRTEHLVWQPRWLAHPNGALGLTSVLIAVADVNEAAARFVRFTGRPARPSATGQTIALDRGRLEFMSAAALSELLPELPLPSLPFIAAYCISVHSVEVTESLLVQNRLKVRRSGQELVAVFPRELGCGAWLFRAAGDPQ
jgi:Glyoxalase-like domain